MQEENEKIDAIKLSVGSGGKEYYYLRRYSENSWQRVSKLVYQTSLKYNLPIATEIKKDSDGRIIFMSYKHEKSEVSRERHRKIDAECFAMEDAKPPKDYISIVKKTLGKDGKYYFYESLGSIEKAENVHWFKLDKSLFEFTIEFYREYAKSIQRNERGEIIYMECKVPRNYIPKNEKKKKNNGCTMVLIFFILLTAILLCGINF